MQPALGAQASGEALASDRRSTAPPTPAAGTPPAATPPQVPNLSSVMVWCCVLWSVGVMLVGCVPRLMTGLPYEPWHCMEHAHRCRCRAVRAKAVVGVRQAL